MVEAGSQLGLLSLGAATSVVRHNVDVEGLVWVLTLTHHQVQVILLVTTDGLLEIGARQTG